MYLIIFIPFRYYSYGAIPFQLIPSPEVLSLIVSGARLSKPECCNKDIFALVSSCWQQQREDRPSFEELTRSFELQLILDSCRLPPRVRDVGAVMLGLI